MPMPRDSPSQKTGRIGARFAGYWLEKNGFIYRCGDGETDFGVDGEIEFAGSATTGLLIKCQIKSSADVSFGASGTMRSKVSAATRNQWAAIRLPVVALLVDTVDEKIYWSIPEKVFDSARTAVVFHQADCATDAPEDFQVEMWQAVQIPSGPEILDGVLGFLQLFEELRPEIGRMDPGYQIDSRHEMTLRLVYDHVMRLRQLLGITFPPMWPLTWWTVRSERILLDVFNGGDGPTLLDIVAGEVIEYLAPFYRGALLRLRAVAEYPSVVENFVDVFELSRSGLLDDDALENFFRRDEHNYWPSDIFRSGLSVTHRGLHDVSRSTLLAMDALMEQMSVRRCDLGRVMG